MDIEKIAEELAENMFPDNANVWARGNTEKKMVKENLIWMANKVVDEACKEYSERHLFLNQDARDWEVALFRESLIKCK